MITIDQELSVTIPSGHWAGNNPEITFAVCSAPSPYTAGGYEAYTVEVVRGMPVFDSFECADYRALRWELAQRVKRWKRSCKVMRNI